jgi:hypothetical protein
MSTGEPGRTLDWEGGTLDELLGLLGEPALSAYIEAVRPGSGQAVGEIHVVAGGVAETVAGERRGDEGLAYIKKIPGLRFRVTPAMPNDEGLLLPPPDSEGDLATRPVTAIMRYCEDFVLTCALELQRGPENARISYRRGEIVRTLVDGSESSERLPDVMGWNEGTWRVVLPAMNLPRPKKPQRPAPGEVGGGTLFGIPAPVIPGLTGPPTPAPASAPGMTAAPPAPAPAAPKAPTPAPVARPAASPEPQRPIVRPVTAPAPSPFMPTTPAPVLVSAPGSTVPAARPASASPPAMASAPATVVDLAPPHMTPARPASVPSGIARQAPDDTRATPPAQLTGPPRPSTHRPAPPRTFASLPLVVHVVLGIALGSAVVAGYWAFLRYGAEIGLR